MKLFMIAVSHYGDTDIYTVYASSLATARKYFKNGIDPEPHGNFWKNQSDKYFDDHVSISEIKNNGDWFKPIKIYHHYEDIGEDY